MNGLGILILIVIVGMMFAVPRRRAALALLLGACYIPSGQELDLGALHFTALRIVVIAGLLRTMSKGERMAGGIHILDKLMIWWACWAICSTFFHPVESPITRVGMVIDDLGGYFLFRVFMQDWDDFQSLFKMVCILFIPVTLAMLIERATGKNLFAELFGGTEEVALRHGHFRARGPFGHAITAGTIGAVCLPMTMLMWRKSRKLALTGLAATGGIVIASGSSGPIMTALSILVGLAIWKVRSHLRAIRWGVVALLVALNFAMKDPVYYLVARIDITGGSTGWHRAALIATTIAHFKEWWLVGTDFTRHWMPTGVAWNSRHTDITNYYISMGVWGGLPLIMLFVAVLSAGFASVGRALVASREAPLDRQFLIWTMGAILFGHATTFISVSYFDQSALFLYLTLAAIGSLDALTQSAGAVEATDQAWAAPGYEPDFCNNR